MPKKRGGAPIIMVQIDLWVLLQKLQEAVDSGQEINGSTLLSALLASISQQEPDPDPAPPEPEPTPPEPEPSPVEAPQHRQPPTRQPPGATRR